LAAEHGHLGVGKQVGNEPAVDGGCDRAGELADDDDLGGGIGIALGDVSERRRAVDEAVVLDGQLLRVRAGHVAEVHVTRARGHVDEAVVEEGVVGSGEVEDPILPRRILAVGAPVVVRLSAGAEAGERAGLGVEAGAAAVEEEHDLARVGSAFPDGELAAVGTFAVTAECNLRPRPIGWGNHARSIVAASARRDADGERGQDEKQSQEAAGHSMTARETAGGSRPATSHPPAAATSGTPSTASPR
jgi:hypothetical protein